MRNRIFKWLFVAGFLFCFHIPDIMTVYASEESLVNASRQWVKEDIRNDLEDDFAMVKGKSEKPVRERQQQPVDLRILQQRYPDVFFLQGPSDEKRIALTFDDGPDPRFTNGVLDVLNQYNVPATFFLFGSRAVAHPEIVQRIQNEGHVIGNHTYSHPNLVEFGLETLEREVTRTEDALNEIIGYRTKLFRPPFGFLYNELVEKLREMNYYVIAWSVDSLDWQEDPPEDIASRVLDNIHPGAIILMHDGAESSGDRTNTIESLHQIIPALQEQGYEFVTVPELLNIPFEK